MPVRREGVAVTGLGAVTPLGATVGKTWASMVEGRTGISVIEEDWASVLPVRIAGRVSLDPAVLLSTREHNRMDRCGQLALIAAREAWTQAGAPAVEPERVAVVIGSGYGGLDTTLAQARELSENGPRRVSPHTLTRIMTNAPSAWVSIDLGARGGARTPVSACASGAEAIAQGLEMIRSGDVDVVIAGGVDSCINPLTISGFAQIRALSARNGEPWAASRPFDRHRDGFVIAEGAGILVLEREDFARARGAETLAAVSGAAVTSDASDIVAADPAMQRRVMELALADAGLSGSDLGFVHAHATSTPVGDAREAQAITAVAGNQVPVTSTKSMTGHLLGGAGALGAIVSVQTLKTGVLPGTLNLDTPDPEIDLHLVTKTVRGLRPRTALSNAFGFGGHSASLIFTKAP